MPVIVASSVSEPIETLDTNNVTLVDDKGNVINYHAGDEYTQYLLVQILYQLNKISNQLANTDL